MSISFKCQRCKKKIKAPDKDGGKYGQCPHCNYRCYIPSPPDENEPELKLAAIDENEESDYNEMMRNTHDLTQNILHERAGDEPDDAPRGAMSEKELVRSIIMYLRMVADGRLDQAERMAAKIKPHAAAAKQILKKITRAERHEPELADIPPKLLMGLIKNLDDTL
jgi:DNA-directed RNA polymerase subunit RPC12/RpoP